MMAQSEMVTKTVEPPKKAEEWTRSLHHSINVLHQCLTLLYDGLESAAVPSTVANSNLPSDVSDMDSETPLCDVSQVFLEHCHVLNVFLSTPTNGPVKVSLSALVRVMARCLKVSSVDLKSRPSFSELSGILPSLHQAVLDVVIPLIKQCGSNVLPLSRSFVDMCLQALVGSKFASPKLQSETRTCAFQVLSILVEKFGWGRYLQSHTQTLVDHLISDIQIQEAPKLNSVETTAVDSLSNATPQKQEVESLSQRKGKKRKKGKKHKGDSYHDLSVSEAAGKGVLIEPELFNVAATESALKLSRAILERSEFTQIELLVRCLMDSAKTLHREGTPHCSPYKASQCRQALYYALFACTKVRLGSGASRKDSISHLQASNLAVTLLMSAAHLDAFLEVRDHCKQLLAKLQSVGHVNRPIIRKIQPDEHSDMAVVVETEKDVDKLEREKNDLWRRLVEAQLEIQTQQCELQALRTAALNKTSSEQQMKANSGITSRTQDSGHSGFVEEAMDEDSQDSDVEDNSIRPVESEPENISTNSPTKKAVLSKPDSTNSLPPPAKLETPKRVLQDKADEAREAKKPRTLITDSSECDDVKTMISDFVDAAPDVLS